MTKSKEILMLNVKEMGNAYFMMLSGPGFFSKKVKVAVQ